MYKYIFCHSLADIILAISLLNNNKNNNEYYQKIKKYRDFNKYFINSYLCNM